VLLVGAVAATVAVTATSMASTLGSAAVFSIDGRGGFLGRRRRKFARSGRKGSGLGTTAKEGRHHKGRTTHERIGQSAATQTAPKFGPFLRCRGQQGQNALGRWTRFFSAL
jgi:hypothetical protein